MGKRYYTYIITNKNNTVLYTGITNSLVRRMNEHRTKYNPKCFSAKYNLNKLVWFEEYRDVRKAIAREKQIKAGPRKRKVALINGTNPEWEDLTGTL